LHLLAADHPNLRILICRATRASLAESVLVTYEQEILSADSMEEIASGVQRRVRQTYRYPNGSEISVGGLDKPSRVLSTAWDIVYINEAIEGTEEAWETIQSRRARPGRKAEYGYLIGDTNPGHPSHWLKQRVDAGRTVLWDTRHEANPTLHDGNDWTESGQVYLDKLDRLTGTRRARLRDGLWAVGEGLWFDSFNPAHHVTETAEYDPALPVYLSVDPGVFTGAVVFQATDRSAHVIADYLTENLSARENARALRQLLADRCEGRLNVGYSDPAGGARNPIGPTVLREYEAEGLPLRPWSKANPSVSDSLENVESLLNPIGSPPLLTIHPRCRRLVDAFLSYRRAKRGNQWTDYPEDPQHPHEDLVDALRGGLYARFPMRRKVKVFS